MGVRELRVKLCIEQASAANGCRIPIRPICCKAHFDGDWIGFREQLVVQTLQAIVDGDGGFTVAHCPRGACRALRAGQTLAVTEIVPWPPMRISASVVASSPDERMVKFFGTCNQVGTARQVAGRHP